jgi:hypothetical protein
MERNSLGTRTILLRQEKRKGAQGPERWQEDRNI